ncbi:MAG: hypothetical protein ACTSRP_01760 [Candidatus Helarchaeota archaeon]
MVDLKFVEYYINDPEKCFKFIQNNYSFLKTLIVYIYLSLLISANFWNVNFIIPFTKLDPILLIIFILTGFISIAYFVINYIIYLYLSLRLFSKSKKEKKLWKRIKTLIWIYLIPMAIFHTIIFLLNMILLNIHLNYVAIYIYDYGKYIIYAWIFSLSIYYSNQFDESKKFKNMLLVLVPFIICYILAFTVNYVLVVLLFKLFL